MGREGNFRGRSGGGGGRNGGGRPRHSRGRGGRGNGGGRGGYNRDGGGGGRGRRPRNNGRQAADSGNKRERIAIESGFLVLIDQFMLANPEFIEKLSANMDADADFKNELIREFGGTVVELNPDRYRIERDPYACSIIIHPEGHFPEASSVTRDTAHEKGHVFVDTRCLAMVDRELLDDGSLLEKYRQLWFSGQDKACRDLLRDNGGAVRYGFSRAGDELGVYCLEDEDVVALWPDVIEPAAEGASDRDAI